MPCTVAEIVNADVNVNGVVVNSYVNPPSLDDGEIDAELVDEITKSDAIPVVAPALSLTVMVQRIGLWYRSGGTGWHIRLDALVGVPYTTNADDPFTIVTPCA